MSKSRRLVVLTIAVLMTGIASSRILMTQPAQAQRARDATKTEQRKWEYLYIQSSGPKEVVDKANGLGDQGWEVIAVLPYDQSLGSYIAYLKRSKP